MSFKPCKMSFTAVSAQMQSSQLVGPWRTCHNHIFCLKRKFRAFLERKCSLKEVQMSRELLQKDAELGLLDFTRKRPDSGNSSGRGSSCCPINSGMTR